MRKWGVEEWREVLVMTIYFRHLLKDHPLQDDTPERVRRLDNMSKDVSVKIYELLNKETDGHEEDLR